ncbi:MAG TPA: LysM peptidoglycan-binding domain-containing protein [Cellulomonas sp.]
MSTIAVSPRVVLVDRRPARPARDARPAREGGPGREGRQVRDARAGRDVRFDGDVRFERDVLTEREVRGGRAVRSTVAGRREAAGDGGLRLTVRGRLVLVVLGLLVVIAGVMGGRAVADGPERGVEVRTHAVQSGETMWQIASSVAAPGEDVRDVVIQLQRLNGMDDSTLTAGEVLLLPVGD